MKALYVSVFKTLLFNFYYFPFCQAVKIPVIVGRKLKLGHMGSRGSVEIRGEISPGIIHLGFPYGSFMKHSGGGLECK